MWTLSTVSHMHSSIVFTLYLVYKFAHKSKMKCRYVYVYETVLSEPSHRRKWTHFSERRIPGGLVTNPSTLAKSHVSLSYFSSSSMLSVY